MKLSIIVIFHNMRREATRTLRSLAVPYQHDVHRSDYEVIAIDNGSQFPLDPGEVSRWGDNFRYHFHDTDSVSPVEALNLGAKMARGENLAFIVDGARMASPGLLKHSLSALCCAPTPFVAALSWHLGPDVQNLSILNGYTQDFEDNMLHKSNWTKDGYALFDISTLAQSSRPGFLGGMPAECSWLCLPREIFATLNGYDCRFQSPGGGLVNHDFRDRALAIADVTPIILLGEGVFHQIHGGIATNAPQGTHPMELFQEEYSNIHGARYTISPQLEVIYHGPLTARAERFLSV